MNHNTAANFMSADGSGDKKMKRDILLSEIAKIIVGRPKLVAYHLKKSGFVPPASLTNKNLVAAVSMALNKSPKFAHNMALEILSGNYGADGISETQTSLSESTITKPESQPTRTITEPTKSTESAPPTETRPTTTVSQPAAIKPVVKELGEVFGGRPNTTVQLIVETPIKTSSNLPTENTPSGGGSGGGGGGGGSMEEAQRDLQAKTDSVSGLSAKMKRIRAWFGWGLVFIGIGGTIYYYNSK